MTNDHDVVVDGFAFAPVTPTVPVRATVTWTNRDDVPPNIIETRKDFASPVLDSGDQFSHRFDAAGTYAYYCSLHPRMTGTIVVGAGAQSTP